MKNDQSFLLLILYRLRTIEKLEKWDSSDDCETNKNKFYEGKTLLHTNVFVHVIHFDMHAFNQFHLDVCVVKRFFKI